MTRRGVLGVAALAAVLSVGARLPERGGRVTVLIPDSDEGVAIAAALGDRAAETYLTRPDGSGSHVTPDPGLTGGTPLRRSWTLVFPDASSPNAVDVADRLTALLEARSADPAPGPWTDLTTARALDERRLVLAFADAVCAPLDRLARWPFRPAGRGSFRLASGSGDFARNDRALFTPRLDRLEIILAEPPFARPRRAELTVLPGRSDDDDSTDLGALGEDGLAVVYWIALDPSVPVAERRWLERILSPAAFEPLVAPHEAVALPGCASREAASAEVTPVTAGHVTVTAPDGERGDLLRRRADVVLADRTREATEAGAGNGAGQTIEVTIGRDVVLDTGPISLAAACAAGPPSTRWPILAVAYHVARGSGVIGPIGSPDRLWLAR